MPSVFISSVMGGMEDMRAAAEAACSALDIPVVKAEDFPASPSSPRGACLQGVAEADGLILLLGHAYGAAQGSGKSATEEEVEEAVHRGKAILVFRTAEEHEPAQGRFLDRVSEWEGGTTYRTCLSTTELQKQLTRALLSWSSAPASSDVDEVVVSNLRRVVPEVRRGTFVQSGPWLALSWTPSRQLSPDERYFFEHLPPVLADLLVAGPHRVLSQRPEIATRPATIELRSTKDREGPALAAVVGLDGSVALGTEIISTLGGSDINDAVTATLFLRPQDAASVLGRMFEFARSVQGHLDPDNAVPAGRMQCALALMGMRHFSEPFTRGGGVPIGGLPAQEDPPVVVPPRPEAVVRSQLVAGSSLVAKFIGRFERACKRDSDSQAFSEADWQ